MFGPTRPRRVRLIAGKEFAPLLVTLTDPHGNPLEAGDLPILLHIRRAKEDAQLQRRVKPPEPSPLSITLARLRFARALCVHMVGSARLDTDRYICVKQGGQRSLDSIL